MAEPAISASASTSTSESQSDLQPSRGSEDEILKKPANDRKNAKKKKDVFVDPEVVRRRREEKALARQKAAEAEEQAKANGDVPPKKLRFRKRCMVDIPCQSSGFGQASVPAISNAVDAVSLKITIMTWNLLAQALVRRTLFPGSDLLKWKDRGDIITQEFLHYNPTVACLQEVDKLEHYEPIFKKAGYDLTWQKGYSAKLHGLCIAWKKDRFSKVAEKVVKLDEATFDPLPSTSGQENGNVEPEKPRTACSRITRNLGLFVALEAKQGTSNSAQGIILVTHHLFWHARHQYERTRQVAVLLREIDKFRRNEGEGRYSDWPCFFAGDFNIQPSEGTYRLMTGASLSDAQIDAFNNSSVVHKTLDEYHVRQRQAQAAGNGENGEDADEDMDEDEEGENKKGKQNKEVATGETYAQPEGDEDRVLKNTRPARESDDLLSLDEIKAVYNKYRQNMWSIYGRYYGLLDSEKGNVFGERSAASDLRANFDDATRLQHVQEGYFEPAWTNITPLWRCTLDYIFYMPPLSSTEDQEGSCRVKRLLPTHRLEDMEPGLPRSDKEPSDHIALMAEVEI